MLLIVILRTILTMKLTYVLFALRYRDYKGSFNLFYTYIISYIATVQGMHSAYFVGTNCINIAKWVADNHIFS